MVIEGLAGDAEGGGGEADAAVFEERVEAYGLGEQLVEVAGPGVGDEGAEAGGPELVDAARRTSRVPSVTVTPTFAIQNVSPGSTATSPRRGARG